MPPKRKVKQSRIEGESILSPALTFLSSLGPRHGFSKRFNEFLQKNEDKKVVSVSVGRKPVNSVVQKVLNTLSFGAFDKVKKRLKYDDVYHQYMIVRFDDGTTKKLEYNHQIEESNPTPEDIKLIKANIPVNKDLSLKEMLENTAKYTTDGNFYRYDPKSNNCQIFVKRVVDSNNLLPEVDTEKALETQDSKALIDSLPGPLKNIPIIATDIAQGLDNIIHGGKIDVKDKESMIKARLIVDGIY